MDNQLKRQKAKCKRQKAKILATLFVFLFNSSFLIFNCFAQNYFRVDTIPVKVNGNWLKNPWVGGHNYVQFSDIDMNFDGIKDLFVFDRTGHKVTTYINKGTPNTVDYIDSTYKYAPKFPHLEDWALIRDYNCDGKPDILTYAITVGGIKVWKNTSSGGNLQFTLQSAYIKSDYTPANTTDLLSNLYVTRVDIPTLDDIDGDGDMDVLTFDYSSTGVEFHINKSIELGYNCDSLIFILDPNGCWGNFEEDNATCSISLSACRLINPDSARIANANKPLHTGSCSICLDMDADGDKEIIIGDISCCNMTLLTNSGTPATANITAKDTAFPSTNIPVNMNLFPCGYFLDVDNDSKRDLIVAPNAPNASIDKESIWFYKNTGADNAPVFSRVKRNLFQDDMIETGSGADPVFFDFNNDGLTDLLISNYLAITDSCPASVSFDVWAFENIGTATLPVFNLMSTDYANLSVQISGTPSKHMTFGDIDNDGDKDMFVGDYNGFIHLLNNTAGPSAPANFVYTSLVTDAATSTFIDIGSYAAPQLIDLDRDNDLDMIIGRRQGNLFLYENTGTANTPVFELTNNNLGGVDVSKFYVTGYSVPFMFDSSGKYNLIVGSEASRNYPPTGWIWYYKDIDANLGGDFTRVDSMYKDIWEGHRMIVHGADINADGGMDLVIGNYAGGVSIYMGDSNVVPVPEISVSSFDFSIFPNPSSGYSSITVSNFTPNEKYYLNIYNSIGEIIYSHLITHTQSKIDKILSSGVYSYEVSTKNFSKTKKLVVLK